MSNNQIKLTEQEFHSLIEDAVMSYLINEDIEEGRWGGIKNAWQGMFGRGEDGRRNYNFNFGQTYRSGKQASSFANYAKQATDAIEGMRNIADNNGSQNVSNSLLTVAQNIDAVSKQFTDQARTIANGDAKKLNTVSNPWSDTQSYDDLNRKYTDLQTQNNQLQGNYDTLQGNYNLMQGNYNDLQGDYRTLRGDYDTLQGDYNTLQGNYDTLQGDYDQYKQQYPEQQQQPMDMDYNPEQYGQEEEPQQEQEPQQKPGWRQRISNGVRKFFKPYIDDDDEEGDTVPESRMITVTHDDIRNLVTETLNILINEDGEANLPVDGSDPSMDVTYPVGIVDKNDPSRGRKKGKVAITGEPPVGHDGR